MAEYLGPEWIGELDTAVRRAPELADAAEEPVTVELRVAAADGTSTCYHLVLGPGPARAVAGPALAPDLTLVTDLDAALALRQGTTNAQQCLADGSLRLRGNPEVLTRRVAVLTTVGDLLAETRR